MSHLRCKILWKHIELISNKGSVQFLPALIGCLSGCKMCDITKGFWECSQWPPTGNNGE